MWVHYVQITGLFMTSTIRGHNGGNINPSAAGECQPLYFFRAPGISPSGLLRCGTTPRPSLAGRTPANPAICSSVPITMENPPVPL